MMAARLSRADRLALSKEIFAKAKVLLAASGKPEQVSGHQVAAAKIGGLQLMMTTPFSGVRTGHGDFRYQVEIWMDGIGKVFGAGCDPRERWANEFECFRLVRGEWIAEFLAR